MPSIQERVIRSITNETDSTYIPFTRIENQFLHLGQKVNPINAKKYHKK